MKYFSTVVENIVFLDYFVQPGGKLPAMTVTDSVVRLLPGVLGGETSAEVESFYEDDQVIEAPHYTRPADYDGMKVPEVLLSGNPAEIENWRSGDTK